MGKPEIRRPFRRRRGRWDGNIEKDRKQIRCSLVFD
jgi:hypothetical protein